ncbi:N-formylglutamate amidohydrolase [Formosa agariphila KMM 3901]|uniref:N-formylglutamate amidohydrolase n=1 Tax=Formosa agariphila (strain DSM 15362 / KCTC 12365 / LMG 23005 / KMM 3901 / M-2Alg 35-1) TaxID=1347342 RepID=T2KIT7_FORAG|nr:N-formylglutamate amidohydrolase [Formosa agariphila]CDF78321.1 N-formylglutamate amidohydrolase [Formosa agariphila KMM 3901]
MKLLLTCEHGGAYIPNRFESYFINEKTTLQTHRGFDIGALDVFKYLKPLASFSNFSETSRLLIELNRSLHHKDLFSEYTKTASNETKQRLISGYYLIYRNAVEGYIKKQIDKGETVLHLSVHSFTPILNGIERQTDIGLLYDSAKSEEKAICKQFSTELLRLNPKLKVRYNYPYLGTADGFTTYLRKHFPDNYLGIEIEINQKFASKNAMPPVLKHQIYDALKACLTN